MPTARLIVINVKASTQNAYSLCSMLKAMVDLLPGTEEVVLVVPGEPADPVIITKKK